MLNGLIKHNFAKFNSKHAECKTSFKKINGEVDEFF